MPGDATGELEDLLMGDVGERACFVVDADPRLLRNPLQLDAASAQAQPQGCMVLDECLIVRTERGGAR